MSRILIAGCGAVGSALGQRLVGRGHRVWGIRRSAAALPPGIEPLIGDLTRPDRFPTLPPKLDFVFYTAAADGRSDAHYEAAYIKGPRYLLRALEDGPSPRRLFFTSSTGVYGQRDGSWVDETSPTAPSSFTGQRMLEAEGLLAAGPAPATSVRLGGIYGPGRTRLARLALAGEPVQREPPVFTNRVHLEDCAAILHHLMDLEKPAPIYIGVDNDPASRWEVFSWIRAQRRLPPPPIRQPTSPPPASKRCSNGLLTASGYRFLYPTFRDGYRDILMHLETSDVDSQI